MNLKDARRSAEEVCMTLAPLCLPGMCKIAGSIRRLKPDMIKDIEIVAVHDNRKLHELVDVVNKKWGEPLTGKFPSKYTRIRGAHNIDLFWCTEQTFGLNFFIRTGPQSFVTRALTIWKKTSGGGYSKNLVLHRGNHEIVEIKSEEDVFRTLGWNFVRPENRV